MFGQSIYVFNDRHGKSLVLAPTHEVTAALTAKTFIHSYREMPIRITQTQTKYRDEPRPRGGLIKTCQFTMQDAYSFDVDLVAASDSYEACKRAYVDALTEARIPFIIKKQEDMGAIGGFHSHEFHVPASCGEDSCIDPISGEDIASLEIAHVFLLGDKYTAPIDACYVNRDGSRRPIQMCSFGMGIERTISAYLEVQLQKMTAPTWSWALAPFKILVLGEQGAALEVYRQLVDLGYDAMVDDRNPERISFGQKLREGFMMGLPLYVILGKTYASTGQAELRAPSLRHTAMVEIEELARELSRLEAEIKAIERIAMSFPIAEIDTAHQTVFVQIREPKHLDHHFCDSIEQCTDLLGNFDAPKKLRGPLRLRSGVYRVIPIHHSGDGQPRLVFHNDQPFIEVSDSQQADLIELAHMYFKATL